MSQVRWKTDVERIGREARGSELGTSAVGIGHHWKRSLTSRAVTRLRGDGEGEQTLRRRREGVLGTECGALLIFLVLPSKRISAWLKTSLKQPKRK